MPNDRIRIQPAEGTWVARAGGAVIGETEAALELLHGTDLPLVFFPRADLGMAFLEPSDTVSAAGDNGPARFYNIVTRSGVITDAGWSYENPGPDAAQIAGHITFHPDRVTIERV
ncbi:MAG: DUF427 domain-containing protein [Amaricoccus sp.]